MTRDQRRRIEVATTERVLDQVEELLLKEDNRLWDDDKINIPNCMKSIREKLLSHERSDG